MRRKATAIAMLLGYCRAAVKALCLPAARPYSMLVHWRHGKAGGHDWFPSEMRQAELLSVAETLGLDGRAITFTNAQRGGGADAEAVEALQFVHGLPDPDAATAVAARCVCVRALHHVWAHGQDYADCGARASTAIAADDDRVARMGDGSWCARVRHFGAGGGGKYGRAMRSPPHREEHAVLAHFAPLLTRVPGPISLSAPAHTLYVMSGDFDVGEGAAAGALLTRQLGAGFDFNPYALDRRAFLSTTTMDHEVSFVMANHAQVRAGDAVLDPFAGSGGLLLAAAALGAGVTVGIETDARLRYHQLAANFEQARVVPLTALVHGDMASAEAQAAALRANGGAPFDAVLTDPPYGKRANEARALTPQAAGLDAITALLRLSAASGVLRVGGRVVCFAPTTADCGDVAPHLPSHAALRLESAARQPLSSALARWLLTYVKERDAASGEDVLPPPAIALTAREEGGAPALGLVRGLADRVPAAAAAAVAPVSAG
ncbi:S-adenosyl-L-methionine-dependent methyltransferase [Tribonema minus]|uniref:S-adenosyl-L-methionine-dependent methyltransferase n=1 Tax=Tribonema minus TaxID=303371 RepID=A0A836CDL2_9STRA|nr:S-adenosyl-L-methionine-dependent methyltransferase [Tribonema minus]